MSTLQEIIEEMISNGHQPTAWDKASVEGLSIVHCKRCRRHVVVFAPGVSNTEGRVAGPVKQRCSLSGWMKGVNKHDGQEQS